MTLESAEEFAQRFKGWGNQKYLVSLVRSRDEAVRSDERHKWSDGSALSAMLRDQEAAIRADERRIWAERMEYGGFDDWARRLREGKP